LADIAIQQQLNTWAKEQRLTTEEATRRWHDAREWLAQEEGLDIEAAMHDDLQRGLDLFLAVDASRQEVARAEREAAFKRELLGAPSSDVGAGLTQFTANGYQPLQPRPDIRPRLDPERVVERAVSRPARAEDIKKAMLAEEPGTAEYKALQKHASDLFVSAYEEA
jgi:hypothetical protein